MSFVRSTERQARKEHTCEEDGCRRGNPIKPGTRYVFLFGVFDGEPWTAKLCLRCHRAHQRVFKRFARYDALRAEAEARLVARKLTAIERVRDAVSAVARAKDAQLVALEEAHGFRACRRCSCCDCDWQECHDCGGDGFWLDDHDPLWGVVEEGCGLCETLGGWWMCGGRCDAQGKHEGAARG